MKLSSKSDRTIGTPHLAAFKQFHKYNGNNKFKNKKSKCTHFLPNFVGMTKKVFNVKLNKVLVSFRQQWIDQLRSQR